MDSNSDSLTGAALDMPAPSVKLNGEDEGVCSICSELHGASSAIWPMMGVPEGISRVLSENEKYVALVSIGPLAEGHCLVFPKHHRCTMCCDERSEEESLLQFGRSLAKELSDVFGGRVILFEHGTTDSEGHRPCSVGHAHWHLVPAAINTLDLESSEEQWFDVPSPFVRLSGEYLILGELDKGFRAYSPGEPIESQLLRKRIATALGNGKEWDWRSNPRIEVILDTIERFRRSVKSDK